MRGSMQNRVREKRRLDEQKTRTFGAMEFVRAQRNQVRIKMGNVGNGELAEALHGVRVEKHTIFGA